MNTILVTTLFFVSLLVSSQAECTTNCTTKVLDSLSSPLFGSSVFSYYRSTHYGPLRSFQPSIERVIIVVNGADGNADDYYCIMEDAVQLYFGFTKGTYVVSPFFRTKDNQSPGTLYWDSNNDWSTGGLSAPNTTDTDLRVSSFTVLDEMFSIFLDYFPSLQEILITGHSGGAQTVHRYALGTTVDLDLRKHISLRYVPANSPSYTYFDTVRPILPEPDCKTYCNSSTASLTYSFEEFPNTSCPKFNTWKYGLEKLNTYMTNTAKLENIADVYLSKKVIYLLGQNDTCNEVFNCGCSSYTEERGCEAEVQGQCRFQRGIIYYQYLQQYYDTTQKRVIVPDVGHDACGMYTSKNGLLALFSGHYYF